MVWAAFSFNGQVGLAFLDDRQNSPKYIETLENHLMPFAENIGGGNWVNFHYSLSTASNKKDCVPDFLKQLALEIINNIHLNDIKIYTDGSKTDKQAGSGIYIETPRYKYSIKQRNPDFCSVFRSELLALDVGLETIMSESNFGDLWILTDSHSSIQHVKNWTYIGDKTSLSILQKLKLISLRHDVHFQWIP
ncbi:hypothetical protein AVEN_110669-1 [Araneus ventricosus]|uniref:RNase H type-1 domain-containing protein n=1 Tax=Araneus ventricosus TaxID=182803 RepID=A0A4Y2AV07_ARAVE|nr:hypothetical protein AVEN_110669-1 [Araneus ventricosus]